MSNKEIFLKSFADLLHSYNKLIKHSAFSDTFIEEKKEKNNNYYYKYLNDYEKIYEKIEKDNLEKYNIKIKDIKKIIYDLKLEKELRIIKDKHNKPIAIVYNFSFYNYNMTIKNDNLYINRKRYNVISLNFSKRKMYSFKRNSFLMCSKEKIDQKKSLKKLYKLIYLILDMYNHRTFDIKSKDYNSLEIRAIKFNKFIKFYTEYFYNVLFSIKKDLIFNTFNNHKLFKIEKEDTPSDDKQHYVIVYKNQLKLIHFSLYKNQLYCDNCSLYNKNRKGDYRLYAREFLRDYVTMGL